MDEFSLHCSLSEYYLPVRWGRRQRCARTQRTKNARERSEGLLLRPRILDPDFLYGYEFRIEIESYRFYIVDFLFFSFFKNILSIKYFGHLASPNCAIP
jgi:hypothetical protein